MRPLAPTSTTITSPPGLDTHILWEARAIAAHCHWGVKGGLVVVCVYLNTDLGFLGENLSIIWRIAEYCMMLNARGYDWVVLGDFNLTFDEVNANRWVEGVRGHHITSTTPTCIKELPGSKIDYAIACHNIMTMVDTQLHVDVEQ